MEFGRVMWKIPVGIFLLPKVLNHHHPAGRPRSAAGPRREGRGRRAASAAAATAARWRPRRRRRTAGRTDAAPSSSYTKCVKSGEGGLHRDFCVEGALQLVRGRDMMGMRVTGRSVRLETILS